jgi:hypothetical protein
MRIDGSKIVLTPLWLASIGLVRVRVTTKPVIPAKAGIHSGNDDRYPLSQV